jgi:hypothetical protein
MTTMTVRLVGGPLDGMVIPDLPVVDPDDPGAYMIVPGSLSRAIYEPDEGGDPALWKYRGDIG